VNVLTEDRFLNGRIVVQQPREGFRSGLDAVMLAAAVPASGDEDVLELGCGAGIASLCLAARCTQVRITGIDVLAELVGLAQSNARANGMEQRLSFATGNALAPPPSLRRDYDHVFTNPPFHDDSGEKSPLPERALALADEGRLGEWLSAGLRRVRSQGTFTAILRADRLGEALTHLPGQGLTLFPLWPRSDAATKRVIVQVRKGSRARLAFLPGLILHESDGRFTTAADAVLRDGGSLALGSRPL
jgi:tRNA1Val (adenine37-N6)-methyltransferase